MPIATSTLRPGLLVSLKTTISGNVKYKSVTIEGDHIDDDGALRAKWETERTVRDADEMKRATEARSKARYAVSKLCSDSGFGLLCPEDRRADLENSVAEARAIAAEFNASARYSQITVNVIAGRIAADDAEAVRAINSEVRELLEAMERGVEKLDPAAIRAAANKAKQLGAMLTPAAAARVADAIEAARGAARRIVKAGETAAQEVDAYALRKLASARTEFLDLDEAGEVAAPTVAGRAVDLDPDVKAVSDAYIEQAKWERDVERFGASLDMDEPTPPTMRAAPAAPMFALDL